MTKLLILRPRPGAERTAARARELGLDPVVAPLFEIRPLDWAAPDPADFEAVLLTSANAVRFGGLTPFLHLPCYAVGEATAAAAEEAGFPDVRTGPSDGAALVGMMAADGIESALHLCGRDHVALVHPSLNLRQVSVYSAEAAAELPGQAVAAIEAGALVLLHSPRAGELFGGLAGAMRDRIRIAAISPGALQAAGRGWKSADAAPFPRDEALLELAAKLCHTADGEGLER